MPCASSCAKAPPPTTRAANNVMPKAKQADRVAWCTVFSLRYLLQAAAVLTWEAVVSTEPKAKRSASSYPNISWVQHIGILPTAQDASSRGGGPVGHELGRPPTPEVRRTPFSGTSRNNPSTHLRCRRRSNACVGRASRRVLRCSLPQPWTGRVLRHLSIPKGRYRPPNPTGLRPR
jgi:hypothetical protein